MPTYKLTIEYEGTRYSGWQAQGNTSRTVQGLLTRAAQQFLGKVEVGGSGRTDAGVHAAGQVAHLRSGKHVAPAELVRALNDLLPHDIHILHAARVADAFHARHDAASRFYLYQISRRRTALGKSFVWWIRDPLDADAIRRAGELLVGRRDFAGFSDKRTTAESTVVVVEGVSIREDGDLILIRIAASHFLWKMVRKVVAAVVEVGRGRLSLQAFQQLLDSGERFQPTAPPSGLFLEAVLYPGEIFDRPMQPIVPVFTFGPRATSAQRWASRKKH
jgi:tRNA pseudouridine38-40 synthase